MTDNNTLPEEVPVEDEPVEDEPVVEGEEEEGTVLDPDDVAGLFNEDQPDPEANDVADTKEARLQKRRRWGKRIDQAVKEGAMTQENADWLLEGLEKGFLNKKTGS